MIHNLLNWIFNKINFTKTYFFICMFKLFWSVKYKSESKKVKVFMEKDYND